MEQHTKLYFRGTPRPKIFPFGEGVSPTLNTMQGGNRQPFIKVPEATKKGYAEATVGQAINLSVMGSKTRRGRVSDVAQTLDTGMQQHTLTGDMKIRRLTPTECERLQGFPEVKKSSIIEICLDPQKNSASAENRNLKSLKSAGSAEEIDSSEIVSSAEQSLSSNLQPTNEPAQVDVLISCGEKGVEIHSQGKCLLNATGAEKQNWYHPHISLEDFVHLVVGLNTIAERITLSGKEESHPNEPSLTPQENGLMLVRLSGKEITQPAKDAGIDSTTLKELSRFITSSHLEIREAEQFLKILSSYVIHAITGFIPKETLSQNTWTIQLNSKVGWTWGVSDTQRYKCLGNAVTVNVIQAIMEKLL